MKIATYNINGITARLPVLTKWLEEAKPDVVCLQELKAPSEKFPEQVFMDMGYQCIWQGQKSWNGVAILSKGYEIKETKRGLDGDSEDTQSRYLEAFINGVLIGCIYLPNGNPAPGIKLDYKLNWFKRLQAHAEKLITSKLPFMLVGDYNVMPTELDVYKPEKYIADALFLPAVRKAFEELLAVGLTDALRKLYPNKRMYTFYDYMRNAYARDAGLRLDHFLVSAALVQKLKTGHIHKEVRGWEKSSDHCPVWIELDL